MSSAWGIIQALCATMHPRCTAKGSWTGRVVPRQLRSQLRQLRSAAIALRRNVADLPDRETARALPTLGGVEPLYFNTFTLNTA
jgi:hypothetical protein